MLLGELMERSLANSPHIVWGAERRYESKQESHTVLATGQQQLQLREQRNSEKKVSECFPHPSSDSSLEILK